MIIDSQRSDTEAIQTRFFNLQLVNFANELFSWLKEVRLLLRLFWSAKGTKLMTDEMDEVKIEIQVIFSFDDGFNLGGYQKDIKGKGLKGMIVPFFVLLSMPSSNKNKEMSFTCG